MAIDAVVDMLGTKVLPVDPVGVTLDAKVMAITTIDLALATKFLSVSMALDVLRPLGATLDTLCTLLVLNMFNTLFAFRTLSVLGPFARFLTLERSHALRPLAGLALLGAGLFAATLLGALCMILAAAPLYLLGITVVAMALRLARCGRGNCQRSNASGEE